MKKLPIKKHHRWYIVLTVVLVFISISVYAVQLKMFKSSRDTLFYFFQDLAFLPLSVLLVTFIVDNLLKKREKHALQNKLNMVVGAFFNEMGNELIKRMIVFEHAQEHIRGFMSDKTWSNGFVRQARKDIREHEFRLNFQLGNLLELKDFLLEKRTCLMRMLENPNLLEHEAFSDLLWALSHLTEELLLRQNLEKLVPTDEAHLLIDTRRALFHLLLEYISYMRHLRDDYPYMFSLALRMNPFEKNPKIEID